MYKKVYVKVFETFSKDVDCCEFTFENVDIEDTAGFLTIYDNDGTLTFRCHINEIAKFIKYK